VNRKILITGGLGCLGSGMSLYLKNNSYDVLIGSRRNKYHKPKELQNCSLIKTDYNDLSSLDHACKNIDTIIHLAATNSQTSSENPRLAYQVNFLGTKKLINSAIKNNVRNFIYFSTAHVYGSSLNGNITENSPLNYSTDYASTHKMAEDYLLTKIVSKEIVGTVFRLSNSVGLPLVKDANCWDLFLNNICIGAISQRKIKINSNPYIKKDFVQMEQVYRIVQSFIDNDYQVNFPVFNIGSGKSRTLLETAKLVAKSCDRLFNFSPQITYQKNFKTKNEELPFEFNINKLQSCTSLTVDSSISQAIDKTLMFLHAEKNLIE